MAVPAARYLVCFDKPEPDLVADREPEEEVAVFEAVAVEDDSAARLQEAFCRGKEEGIAIAHAAFTNELVGERRRLTQELEIARTKWTDEVVERLAGQIPAAFQDVEARIAASVSRILRLALLAAVRDEVIASVAAGLPKLRSGDGGRMIAISGSSAMLDKLRSRVPELGLVIEFVPSDNVEVRVIADQTILESQIQAWLSMLEQTVE